MSKQLLTCMSDDNSGCGNGTFVEHSQEEAQALEFKSFCLDFELPPFLIDGVSNTSNTHAVSITSEGAGTQCDYFLGKLLLFSDHNQNGKRIRTSYNMLGTVEGQRVDLADGQSESKFKTYFNESLRVNRSTLGMSIWKKDDADWVLISNQEECSRILDLERQTFTPPSTL